jgi:hypothetical protein
LPHVLFVPYATQGEDNDNIISYINYGGTLNGLRSRAKNITNPIFSRFEHPNIDEFTPLELEGQTSTGIFIRKEGAISTDGGPGGSPALELQPPAYEDPFTQDVSGLVVGPQGFSSAPESGPVVLPRLIGSVNVSEYLVYAAVPYSYDTILRWQRLERVQGEIDAPPYNYLTKTQTFAPAQARYTLSVLREFTHEVFVRKPRPEYASPRTLSIVTSPFTGDSGVPTQIYNISAAGLSVSIQFTELVKPDLKSYTLTNESTGETITFESSLWSSSDSIGDLTPPSSGTFGLNRLTWGPEFTTRITAGSSSLKTTIFPDSDLSITRTINADGTDSVTSEPSLYVSVTEQEWTHIAVCRKVVDNVPVWGIYINGIQLLQTPADFSGGLNEPFDIIETSEWEQTFGQQPPSASLRMVSLTGSLTPGSMLNPAISGYRFTPKALYTQNFEPPTSITNFA